MYIQNKIGFINREINYKRKKRDGNKLDHKSEIKEFHLKEKELTKEPEGTIMLPRTIS